MKSQFRNMGYNWVNTSNNHGTQNHSKQSKYFYSFHVYPPFPTEELMFLILGGRFDLYVGPSMSIRQQEPYVINRSISGIRWLQDIVVYGMRVIVYGGQRNEGSQSGLFE